MNRTKVILIHIICWTLFLLYMYGGYMLKKVSFLDFALGFSMNLIQLIQFYICFLWVYPMFVKTQKITHLLAGIFVAFASFIFLRYFIEEVVYNYFFNISNYGSEVSLKYYLIDNVYYGISFIVVSAGFFSLQQNFKAEIANKKLKHEIRKSELAFLKSQINPHFLYNTLNYLYSLAIPVSETLAHAVLQLSDLMRYTLEDTTSGMVKLQKEVAYMHSYIALFKMRFEPNFFVNISSEGIHETQEIPALVLIPFIENAFKHGVINDPHRPIKINLKVANNKLLFEVSNKINHSPKELGSGVGLSNVQRRLELIYEKAQELLISNNGNSYKVTLIINLNEHNEI